jgi:4-carboxymuconolactone decarboxylase
VSDERSHDMETGEPASGAPPDARAEALDPRARSLIAIGAAAVAGRPEKLEAHLVNAVRSDPASLPGIREVMFQLVPFCGWAVTLNAITVLRKVLDDHGLEMPPGGAPLEDVDRKGLRALGATTALQVTPFFEKVAAGLREFDPDFLAHLTESAYGYVYNRPGLDLVTRELVAVAILNVAGQDLQLRYHVSGALNVGASREAVRSAIAESERAIADY